MQLTMTVLRCPDAVAPETRTVAGGEFSVGRGPGVDWVLPDPARMLSKRHFAVAYRGGVWQLADTSTNGTYLNREGGAIGTGDVRSLRDGDRLRLGDYEIEIRLAEDAVGRASGSMRPDGGLAANKPGDSPFGDPFSLDPFAPKPPAHTPFNEPAYPNIGSAPTGAQLPHDFDPLAPEPGESPFLGPTQADHSASIEDAFRPPASVGQMPLHSGGVIPGDDLLPDDWDKDLLAGIAPPHAQPVPPTVPASATLPLTAVPVALRAASPFDEPPPAPGAPSRAAPSTPATVASPFDAPPPAQPQPLRAAPSLPAAASPFDEPPPQPAPSRAAPAVAGSAARPDPEVSAGDVALLAAFLEGVGLPDTRPNDPIATMLALGKAFRTLVAGLRAVLIARAAIKSEFRIGQTVIRAQGNNPLKFSAGDDDALTALLGAGRRTDMAPQDAVADALRDIRLHELASMAAMQAAVRTMLDGLDPAKLRASAEQGGGMTLLPAQKKARAWDAYEALHTRTVQALADDFDSVFGKAFARAYERALDEVSAKERG